MMKSLVKAARECLKLFFLFVGIVPMAIRGSEKINDAELTRLIHQSRVQSLSEDEEWRRILYIGPAWFSSTKSVIDDPSFFNAEDGKTNPQGELEATLSAFFDEVDSSKKEHNSHPLCRFPARFFYLKTKLGIDEAKLPKPACVGFDNFWKEQRFQSIALVFSSYYANNPASTFGHTFLRLKRDTKRRGRQSGLLDSAVNFSAVIKPGINPLVYTWSGLTGGFEGKFFFVPYYEKVQEYNNYDTRDLWQYELDLKPHEIDKIVRSVWEVLAARMDYYYFDDNCSYMMLAMLNVGSTNWDLVKEYYTWNTPLDTIQTVVRSPIFTGEVIFTPSAKTRFENHYRNLTADQQKMMRSLLRDKDSRALSGLDVNNQARVMDTAIEYIDFQEKEVAYTNPDKLPKLRGRLLASRSKIKAKPFHQYTIPWNQRPDYSHGSNRIGVGYHSSDALLLDWLPSLHELSSPSTGFSPGMEVQITGMQAMARKGRLELTKVVPVRILSVSPDRTILTQDSWVMETELLRRKSCFGRANCFDGRASMGTGKSFGFGSTSLVYGLALVEGGYDGHTDFGGFAGAGALLGGRVVPLNKWVGTLESRYMSRWNQTDQKFSWSGSLAISYQIQKNQDLKLSGQVFDTSEDNAISLELRQYM